MQDDNLKRWIHILLSFNFTACVGVIGKFAKMICENDHVSSDTLTFIQLVHLIETFIQSDIQRKQNIMNFDIFK